MDLTFFKNYRRDGTVTIHLEQGCSPNCRRGRDSQPATEEEFAYRLGGSYCQWGYGARRASYEERNEKVYRRWTCRQCWWRFVDRVRMREEV
jgi:hypothetical protein